MSIPLYKLNVTVIAEGTREAPKRFGVSATLSDIAHHDDPISMPRPLELKGSRICRDEVMDYDHCAL